MDVKFIFGIGDRVRLKSSKEEGEVRSLSIDHLGDQQVFVHYVAGDKRAVSAWWCADQLERV